MGFILAVLVFGGLLAITWFGYTSASRQAAALHTTGVGRRHAATETHHQPAPASEARPAAPAMTEETVTGEDHPMLKAGSAEQRSRPSREKAPKIN